MPSRAQLVHQKQSAFRAAVAFLTERLEERETVDWALRLSPADQVSRSALEQLLDHPSSEKMSEPWRTAWRLIQESWRNPSQDEDHAGPAYYLQQRIRGGDRSGELISAIVETVAPRLAVEPFSKTFLAYRQPPKRPKKPTDLFSATLKGGSVFNPEILELSSINELQFLNSLANELESALNRGLDIARRIGRSGRGGHWEFGGLNRVYYVPEAERPAEEHEPDEFHHGVAPSTKLLFAVTSRIADIDVSSAVIIVRRWKVLESPVHIRLWAAAARNPNFAAGDEIGRFLLSIDKELFWDVHNFPEIVELRSRRFADLPATDKRQIEQRIKRGPPRSNWPKTAPKDQITSAQRYWALRELRRIELGGGLLSDPTKGWMIKELSHFPELRRMDRIDHDFSGTSRASWVPPNPDSRYDTLHGAARLQALENALRSARVSFDDDPSSRAWDWIRQDNNVAKLISDFESLSDAGAPFAKVWDHFGWQHTRAEQPDAEARHTRSDEVPRALALLALLPSSTLRDAIEGLSYWLSSWATEVAASPEGVSVWFKMWPVAVERTNAIKREGKDSDLNIVVRGTRYEDEPKDLDALNTPAGRLVGVFLKACPNLQTVQDPFANGTTAQVMRDTAIAAASQSGLIVRHRLLEFLGYFFKADPDWTREYLIKPLLLDNAEAVALWRAIARRRQYGDVLRILGSAMITRATDARLARETRQSLVFSVVIDALHSLRNQGEPAVDFAATQQMIRALDDELRAYAANAIQRFVHDVSAKSATQPDPPSAGDVFKSAAEPFLRDVWPQERSLSTPGVSKAFADLPATSREGFSDAVEVIERFLVPFQSWSMLDYGLYGQEEGEPKLARIITSKNAGAFLKLLNLTIGSAEGATVPLDLASALDHVRKVTPQLADTQAFHRLSTAARRV
jgi:hypothetical protein